MLDQKQFSSALKQICEEKGISEKQVMETIESALAAAYRKDYGNKLQNIKVDFDPANDNTKLYDVKTVVEDVPEVEENKEEETDEIKSQKSPPEADQPSAKKVKSQKVEKLKDDKKRQESNIGEEEIKKFNPKTEIQLSEAK
ncbi:hypothetical protein K8R61_01505, partial [bacterium]|nr:hypothetical protein [bacterium]